MTTDPIQKHHVPALDGLRALAVTSVMMFHFGLPIHGGSIGVDAFFVLSGFLITGVMVKDFETYGRVRFGWFWSRRIKRLAPAALFVIISVALASYFLSPMFRKPVIAQDIVATLAYLANWHFIENSSYFLSDGESSPLLHMWSLAVEEQFYLVWPFVFLILGITLGKKSLKNNLLWLAILMSIISVALLAFLWDPIAPERAYMGTDSRIFQLGIGAITFCLIDGSKRWVDRRWRRESSLFLSLGVLGFAAFFIGNNDGLTQIYYQGGALIVGVAAAISILAVTSGESFVQKVLSTSPFTLVGKLSYGMYLWHWPLFVFSVQLFGESRGLKETVARSAALFLLTTTLAALSYKFVESPIRFGARLSKSSNRKVFAVFALASLLIGAFAKVALSAPGTNKTMLIVGDSVPYRITAELDQSLNEFEWNAVNAAYGNCPALAFPIADPSGNLWGPGLSCETEVSTTQESALEKYDPSAVLWWSRYEISDRLDSLGTHVIAGTDQFWDLNKSDLHKKLDAMQANGAAIILVKIEPPGMALANRPECSNVDSCHWFLSRMLGRQIGADGVELNERWNGILEHVASERSNVYVLDISGIVCSDDKNPCTDNVITDTTSRPDGSHFSPEAALELAPQIVEFVMSKVGN